MVNMKQFTELVRQGRCKPTRDDWIFIYKTGLIESAFLSGVCDQSDVAFLYKCHDIALRSTQHKPDVLIDTVVFKAELANANTVMLPDDGE